MATQLQIRRGTNSQVAAFTGAEGEIVVNTTNDSVHVNDGSTAGGFEMARADLNNVSDTSLNAALTGNTVSALTITTLTLGATAITATGAELNILDGVTSTAAELNILDGVTSTTAELNILDGVTATTAELNYVDGVTSAIQTQIDTKAPLASPTFTGTVTATGLTVDTNTLVVDATNNLVGIGNSSPSSYSSSARQLVVGSGSGSNGITITSATNGSSAILFADGTSSGQQYDCFISANHANSSLLFGTGATGGTDMTLDQSGNLGIGESNPAAYGTFVVKGTATQLALNASSGKARVGFFENGTGRFYLDTLNGSDGLAFVDADGSSERLRIDESGDLNIVNTGQASLNYTTDGSLDYARITGGKSGSGVGDLRFFTYSGGIAERLRIDSGGNAIFTKSGGAYLQLKDASAVRGAINVGTSDGLVFTTGSSFTERMRIDASGNLIVGKAVSGTANTGAELRSGVSNHAVVATSSSEAPVVVNRRDNNGVLISLLRNQVSVGNIGALASEIAIGSGDAYWWTSGNNNAFLPASTVEGGSSDGLLDLGSSGRRFDDIYATNGTIQTSDRNEKQDIAELSDAEKRVAVAAKGLLRKFRWISSVEENGDDARIHFGIIAQDLQDAFTAEGLDAGRYAMFISSTWTDEDGNEQTRLGVRYSELLAFIISAI